MVDFPKGMKSGNGKLFDATGKLIYEGEWNDDAPVTGTVLENPREPMWYMKAVLHREIMNGAEYSDDGTLIMKGIMSMGFMMVRGNYTARKVF